LPDPPAQLYQQGVSVIAHEYLKELPHVKTINYLIGLWLQDKIQKHEAFDALYHWNGIISEFPRSNIFIVTRENVLVTPAKNILPGITRKKVLELAKKKYKTEVRDINLSEVLDAKEVFMTSTSKRIIPVVKIDGKTIADGKPGLITIQLLMNIQELEQSEGERSSLRSKQAMRDT
jgi:branched-chain amino acid aminotransferase